MARPKSHYHVGCCPDYSSYKPEGCACSEVVEITMAEIESLRLKNLRDLDQTEAARHMGISQSTFQRILSSAHKKVSRAILEGAELRIVG